MQQTTFTTTKNATAISGQDHLDAKLKYEKRLDRKKKTAHVNYRPN